MSSSSSSSNTSRIVQTRTSRLALLQRDLYNCGFDIVVPFHPQWYNDCLDQDDDHFKHLLRLPSTNDNSDNTNVVIAEEAFLIGNTKHLWPFFKTWLREQNDDSRQQQNHHQQQQVPPEALVAPQENDASSRNLKISHHPLDSYCQECIGRCVEKHFHQQKLQQTHNGDISEDDNNKDNAEECCIEQQYTTTSKSPSYRIYWSCTYAPDKMVSMQHVSMVSGFAYFDPLTNLCVHPVYGAWHAYRAVLVVLSTPRLSLSSKTTTTTTTTTTMTMMQENDDNTTSAAVIKNKDHHLMKRPTSTPPPPPPPPPRVPCLLSVAEQECARVALARAIELCTSTNSNSADSEDSSSSTKKSCFDLLLHGQDEKHKVKQDGCNQDHDNDKNTNSNDQHHDDDDNDFLSICQAWIALRDCVQTGKEEYRYDYDQLMYHFTKDKRYLQLLD